MGLSFFKKGSFTFFTSEAILKDGVSAPKMLNIEPTNECNCNCVMCSRPMSRRPKGFMEFKLYESIINGLVENNTRLKWLTLHNDGEPLLHPDIGAMISLAKKKDAAEYVHFNTNALLMDEAMSQVLIESGLDDITISIDAVTDETFQKVKRAGSLKTVVENTKKMMELKQRYGSKTPHVRAKIIDMPITNDEIERFCKYWKDIVDEVQVQLIHNAAGSIEADKDNKILRHPCSLLWYSFAINWEGIAYPCCVDLTSENRLGDLNKETVNSVFNGKRIKAMRHSMVAGRYDDLTPCSSCNVWMGCENIFQNTGKKR